MNDPPPIVDDDAIVDRMDDSLDAPMPGWDDWAEEASDFERRFAKALLEAEVGDAIVLLWMYPGVELPTGDVLEGEDGYFEIRYRDDRPGVTELRPEREMTAWVIREKYIFITDRDAEELMFGGWHDESPGEWVVVKND